jgi:hypothetical protein
MTDKKRENEEQTAPEVNIEDLPLEASTEVEVRGGMKGEAPTMSSKEIS